MSVYGKISLLISGFCFIVMAGARFVLGTWHPLLYGFLLIFALGFILSLILDFKIYLEFLSMKTARKGLSLGWSLIIFILFLIALSYLGNRFNQSWDLTEEGINSLSEQSTKALENLDDNLTFYIFYKGEKISQRAQMIKQELKNNLNLYKQNSSKVKVVFVDTYKEHLKAEAYLSDLPDKNQQEIFVFVNYKNRKIRAEIPFGEEALTSALIKSQKREFKKILFLTGHGEKELDNENPDGLKILDQALKDSGFITEQWSIFQQGPPPKTTELVISIGPVKPFLDAEKTWLKQFLSQGGNFILSLDPKEKHQLGNWLKSYGVIFNNDFILSQLGLLYGGATKALGTVFDYNNPITKTFKEKRQAVFFEQSSSIDLSPKALKDFTVSYLVKSHNQSFTTPNLTNKKTIQERSSDLKSLVMAIELSEKTKDENKKAFRFVLFGDSDFLTNRNIYEGANRDLALNTFMSLTGEEKLVSIRPKLPKGTAVNLNRTHKTSLTLAYIIVPLLFLLMSLWMWFKKREA